MNKLDDKVIVNFLNKTKEMGLADLICYVWENGFECGIDSVYDDCMDL